MSENIEKAPNVPPFVTFVTSAVPMVFDDSLSYYEALCALWKWLQDDVVNVINNNATVTEDYIQLTDEMKEYMDNYFDNLDVQEEINNKLDELATDGTLYRLINDEIFGDINNRVLHQAQQIAELESDQTLNVKKDESNSVSMNMLSQAVREALTGGSTAVVGEDSVGTENIKDKAVTILKLDENIRNNFDIKITPVDKGTGQDGYYYITGNEIGGNIAYNLPSTDNINYCYVVNLVKGKTYRFTGFNHNTSRGLIIGTAVGEASLNASPSMAALNQGTYTGLLGTIYGTDIIFTVTEDNLKAFITTYSEGGLTKGYVPSVLKDVSTLYEVTDITPYNREVVRDVWSSATPMYTYEHSYMQQTVASGVTPNTRNPYRIFPIDNDAYDVRIYKLYKNHKYRATGSQQYANVGFMLLDNACELVYMSQQYSQDARNDYEYEFTATNDGFAILQDSSANNKSYFYEATESSLSSSRLNGLKIAYNGDSITESRTDSSSVSYNGGAYPEIIADLTNSSYENFAVSGGTLAEISTSHHQVVNDIVNMNGNYDAIILSGGINDYWKNVPLGDYSVSDYSGEVDITTICGALESIFRQAINKWCGKPIMFVITHKIYGTAFTQNTAGYTFDDVHEKIVGICNKYAIPYYDCYEDGGLNSYLPIMNSTYMTAGGSGKPDYTHPNEAAYKRYYVPQVISLIENNLKY